MTSGLKHPIRTTIGICAAFASAIASVYLIFLAATEATPWHVVSFSIYGLSLVTLWTVSTLFHSLNVSDGAHKALERLDHAMIYFLIAGTYTPICLIVLRGGWGWGLFGVNWALAVVGIVLKLALRRPSQGAVATFFIFYILMGWLLVIAWLPLAKVFSEGGRFWLVLGGVFYTVGAVVFNIKRLDLTPQFGSHEIWHIFVLAGSFSHFWMMLRYVLYLD